MSKCKRSDWKNKKTKKDLVLYRKSPYVNWSPQQYVKPWIFLIRPTEWESARPEERSERKDGSIVAVHERSLLNLTLMVLLLDKQGKKKMSGVKQGPVQRNTQTQWDLSATPISRETITRSGSVFPLSLRGYNENEIHSIRWARDWGVIWWDVRASS